MAYGETTIRAQIKTVLESVTGIGKVHDYERWMEDWNGLLELFKTTVGGVDQLRAWMISLERVQQMLIGFEGGGVSDTRLVTYTYRVRGFLAVDDSEETEKTMVALMLSAAEALEADTTLQSETLIRDTPVVAEMMMDYRLLAGVLCHYAEIRIQPQEVV